MMRKNKCVNCFDCPSCGNVLSTRASNVTLTTAPVAADAVADSSGGGGSASTTPDPKGGASKKVFYLACGFCRWSSRDVGIPDQTVASGAWPEQENPHERRISDLMAYYRYLAAMEKAEKDRRKSPRKRAGTQLLQDKYGLTSVVAKRRHGGLSAAMANLNVATSRHGSPGDDPAGKRPEVARVEAKSEVEPLPPDIYTLPLNLSQVCTMKQRLAAPDVQPISRSQLHPLRKHLQVKRSLRCKECDHYVLKPEYNAASIKFKICCTATHHVPEVRIKHIPALSVEKTSEVVITITNPVERQIQCSLVPLNLPEDESPTTSSIALPSTEIALSAKDEAGEYDLATSTTAVANNSDAPNQNPDVVFTKGNKVGLSVHVTPSRSALDQKGRVVAGFCLKYDYRNLSALQLKSEQGKEPEIVSLEIPVMLELGMLSESYA